MLGDRAFAVVRRALGAGWGFVTVVVGARIGAPKWEFVAVVVGTRVAAAWGAGFCGGRGGRGVLGGPERGAGGVTPRRSVPLGAPGGRGEHHQAPAP